jgi:hypothetical protein
MDSGIGPSMSFLDAKNWFKLSNKATSGGIYDKGNEVRELNKV